MAQSNAKHFPLQKGGRRDILQPNKWSGQSKQSKVAKGRKMRVLISDCCAKCVYAPNFHQFAGKYLSSEIIWRSDITFHDNLLSKCEPFRADLSYQAAFYFFESLFCPNNMLISSNSVQKCKIQGKIRVLKILQIRVLCAIYVHNQSFKAIIAILVCTLHLIVH